MTTDEMVAKMFDILIERFPRMEAHVEDMMRNFSDLAKTNEDTHKDLYNQIHAVERSHLKSSGTPEGFRKSSGAILFDIFKVAGAVAAGYLAANGFK